MLPTREIIRRFGRQEWSSRPYTTGKIPHVVADWLAHLGDMGRPCPHSSTSHWISSLHFSKLWTRCVCNLERQQLLLQVTYMVEVRCSERQTGVPNCACGFRFPSKITIYFCRSQFVPDFLPYATWKWPALMNLIQGCPSAKAEITALQRLLQLPLSFLVGGCSLLHQPFPLRAWFPLLLP